MKILITGVHGFVGSNLVKALLKEHTIYGLDIINPSKEGVAHTFSWDEIDEVHGSGLMVHGSPLEIDAIIHLAGKAHDTKSQSAADVYFKVNTELTKKIYDYFLASKRAKKWPNGFCPWQGQRETIQRPSCYDRRRKEYPSHL